MACIQSTGMYMLSCITLLLEESELLHRRKYGPVTSQPSNQSKSTSLLHTEVAKVCKIVILELGMNITQIFQTRKQRLLKLKI